MLILTSAPSTIYQNFGTAAPKCRGCAQPVPKRHACGVRCTQRSLATDSMTQRHVHRRNLLSAGIVLPMGLLIKPETSEALPLAPLGRGSDTIGGPKLQQPALRDVKASTACTISLSPIAAGHPDCWLGAARACKSPCFNLQDILERDLAEGQYFVTGNLTPEVFADDCRQTCNAPCL